MFIMKYDYDNLHIEIDNAAADLKLSPFDALDIWHIGVEQWQKRKEHTATPDTEGCIHCDSGEEIPAAFTYCPFCGRILPRR